MTIRRELPVCTDCGEKKLLPPALGCSNFGHHLQENGDEPDDWRYWGHRGLTMKPFRLLRHEDESGVSGTGMVGSGVLMPSGRVIFEWSKRTSMGIYDSIEQFMEIHVQPHGDKNEIIWL